MNKIKTLKLICIEIKNIFYWFLTFIFDDKLEINEHNQ